MRKIDGKFSTDGTRVFNTVSGADIPEDEPLFLLRARDGVARDLLREYLELCHDFGCNQLHLDGILQCIRKFDDFAANNPSLMKQPGVTRHLVLESEESGNGG